MKRKFPAWIRVLVIFFIIATLVEYIVDSDSDMPAFVDEPLVLVFLVLVLLVLIAIEIIVDTLNNVLYQTLNEKAKERFKEQNEKPSRIIAWIKSTYIKLLGTKPIEKEHEIILDHNYDGIRELDNNLPPWWLYGFYASILFGVIYMAKYHIFNGDNQYDELETEYAEAKMAMEEYKKTAKNLVDVNTVELLTEAADLAKGKEIFELNCVACHKSDGGGGIGPNLTDEYWILGGGIKNVFRTVSEGGRDGKGMVAWKQLLKPLEMAQVSSYLLQFQGTTPAEPKAPEGEIWVEESIDEEGTGTNQSETNNSVEVNETTVDSTSSQ